MSDFVVDAQTTLAWCFEDEISARTDALLDELAAGSNAHVPTLWAYEVANVLLCAERQRKPRATAAKSEAFLRRLAALPIQVDPESTRRAHGRTVALARQHQLTAYDAAYLELALRLGLPLATSDKALTTASKAAGVKLLL